MATQTQLEKSSSAPLAGQLSGLWSMARVRWATMLPRQRGWAAASALTLMAIVAALFWYGMGTDWRTLYSGLESDDARQIGITLTQAQIPFDVSDNGTGIRVPAADLDKARLATAAKGATRSGRMGFEIFDKPNWVGSEFDEQVNYQRALEGELEHTVSTLTDVDSARVHLVLLHESLFRDQERQAKASVVLRLKHRSLADGEPEAIRNLVASAVDGLSPDQVVLVDAAGNMPLGPRTPEALRLSAEQSLQEKLVSTLEPITGAGNVRASVTLDYISTATDETDENYNPDQTVTLAMQRSEQTSGPQAVAAGVPGAASNAPNSQAVPVYPKESASSPQSSKSESSTFAASRVVKHVVDNPGRVRRLTAAIVVNDRMTKAASGKTAAQWQPRNSDELHNLTALAQAAVGFDSARGDVLTVQDMAFDDNRAPEPTPLSQKVLGNVENSPLLLKYTALIACLLLVLALGIRPALRQVTSPVKGFAKPNEIGAGHSAAAAALAAAQPPEVDQDRIRNQAIYEQVTQHLQREPTQTSRLLQSWIHSE